MSPITYSEKTVYFVHVRTDTSFYKIDPKIANGIRSIWFGGIGKAYRWLSIMSIYSTCFSKTFILITTS